MLKTVEPTDKIVNPYQWNAIFIRDGVPYSVNHYPAVNGYDVQHPESVEIRYELDRRDEFEQLRISPEKLGFEFDERGYRVGSALSPRVD